MSAVVWLVVGLALVAAEALTLDLVLVMLGLAALAAAGVAVLGGGLALQLLAVAGASGVLLLGVRPVVKRHLTAGPALPQGSDRLRGRTAVVVSTVGEAGGQVRMDGELWRAVPYAGGRDLAVGEPCVVAGVEGVTLHVYPEELT
ncbi:unannotated protein [freshwater metagenome]|uniref:Unannotated protein n=1 Tax=freshwater metagenome TaxID=449393 RepID=A0A6J7IKS4_9ZZZZ